MNPILAPRALAWLAESRQGRILHLFPRACNLVNERGEVLSLVSAEIGPGPFHLVLPVSRPFPDLIPPDAIPRWQADSFRLGSLWVDLTPVTQWAPRVAWGLWQASSSWQARLPHLCRMVQQYRRTLEAETAVAQPRLAHGLSLLRRGLAGSENGLVQQGAAQLAGLGRGLTPAGDDLLMGAVYGLWATRPEAEAAEWARLVADTAVPRTTTLSAAWLRAAAAGEAGAAWHRFSRQMTGAGAGWREAAARILQTGYSSGADALWGFTAVVAADFKFHMEDRTDGTTIDQQWRPLGGDGGVFAGGAGGEPGVCGRDDGRG